MTEPSPLCVVCRKRPMALVPICAPCKRSLDRADMTQAALITWAVDRARRFDRRRAKGEDFTRGLVEARRRYAQAFADGVQHEVHEVDFTPGRLRDAVASLAKHTPIARAARRWGRAILGRCSGHYDTQGCPKCRKEMKACQAFWEAVVVLDPQLAPLADFRGES